MDRAQATALQILHFSNEPMHNKSVSEVPAIGRKLKEQLVAVGIVTTSDLYKQLQKLNFDEEKFRVWMSLQCSKRARVPIIYQALMAWHRQFGAGPTNEVENPVPRAPGRGRSGLGSTPPLEKRRRKSSQNDVSDISVEYDGSEPSHRLMQYLASFSNIFKNIPEAFHTEFRRDILSLAEKYEEKSKIKEKRNEPQPSTSRY